MGLGTESQILTQSKKAQGETNQRLDALLTEQRRTNRLLEQLVRAQTPPDAFPPPVFEYPQALT